METFLYTSPASLKLALTGSFIAAVLNLFDLTYNEQ